MTITDLGYGPDPEDLLEDEQPSPDEVVEDEAQDLDPGMSSFLDDLISRIVLFCEELSGFDMYPYQRAVAYRVIESMILADAEEITALMARQAGKSESLATTLAGCMVLFPKLAKTFPIMKRFERGLMVGIFAPTDEQSDIVFSRIVSRLTSEHAEEIMFDPEIDDRVEGKSKIVRLRSGSFCRRQTANPRAKIEGASYHIIVIDECFPEATPVLTRDGWVEIADIVHTSPWRGWVVATQEADGSLGWANVVAAYRTPRHTPLVRVDHEYGSVYSTANHPFMVCGEAVPAISLTPGTPLYVVSGAPQSRRLDPREEGRDAVLLQPVSSAVTQPDGRRRHSATDVLDPPGDWTPPQGAGREWSGDDRATAEALGRAWDGLGGRACLPYWRAKDGRGSVPLQAGPCVPGSAPGGGDRRFLTHDLGSPGVGSAQGSVAAVSRVVGVEVLQSGSPEFDQFRDGADYVYTLEVDSPSHTYVAGGVLVGNCQDADDLVIRKSIHPMLAAYAGTIAKIGTPGYLKGDFYKAINVNKRRQSNRRARQNHFEFDYRVVGKYNANYAKFIQKEKIRLGEDSEEFQMSYALKWMLERGMLVTEDDLDQLADPSMQLVRGWHRTPCVVGIDPARVKDSTVVTVMWVDWDFPDPAGYREHRILNWQEIGNTAWEEQYFQMMDFLDPYDIAFIGVDAQGMGSAVADRMQRLMGSRCEVIPYSSDSKNQSERWKHLIQLIQRQMLVYPGHSKARRTRVWRRFRQQMVDAEKVMRGQYLLIQAPDEREAHDDYVDSAALACACSMLETVPIVESIDSPFYR